MTEDTKKIGQTGITASTAPAAALPKTSKSEQIGKNEFMQLLVTQLKNQDPLDPMKSEQFAVNLAQFSQLEQLVSINEKLTTNNAPDLSSLAAYLGHEVTLGSSTVHVAGDGNGGKVRLDVTEPLLGGEIELFDSQGKLRDVIRFDELPVGKHTLELTANSARGGDYTMKVKGKKATGGEMEVQGRVAGVITGFIPGPDPKLLMDGREIAPSDVVEVHVPTQG